MEITAQILFVAAPQWPFCCFYPRSVERPLHDSYPGDDSRSRLRGTIQHKDSTKS